MGTFSIWHILIILIIAVPIVLGTYLLPTIIAAARNHPSKLAIILINIFLGWSGIAWLVCLIWAFVTPSSPRANTYQR